MPLLKIDGVCSVDTRRKTCHVRIVRSTSAHGPAKMTTKSAWRSADGNPRVKTISSSRVGTHGDFRTVYGTGAIHIGPPEESDT